MIYAMKAFFSYFIVYTKILQWFVSESDNIFMKKLSEFTSQFNDNAPYIDSDIDCDKIEKLKMICKEEEIPFSIGKKPINSGTIAIVFKGKVGDQNVAIKILRRGIKHKLKNATDTLSFLVYIMSFIPYLNNISFKSEIECINKKLLSQTCFINEANNIKHMQKSLKKFKLAKQTKVIESLSDESVIVMDFIDGISMDDIIKLSLDENIKYANCFLSNMFFLTFGKNTLHLDLHKGNFLFVEDDICKISLLDMGMIFVVNAEESNLLYDTYMAIYTDECDFLYIASNYKDSIISNYYGNEEKINNILKAKIPLLFKCKSSIAITRDMESFIIELKYNDLKLNNVFNNLILGFLSVLSVLVIFETKGVNISDLIKEKLNKIK